MNKYNLLIFIALSILLFACGDDDDIKSPEIRIGERAGMIVNTFDTTLIGGYYDPSVLNIDLDNDGQNDLQFESIISGSMGVGHHPESSARCLHPNVQIYGTHTIDTTFLNRQTNIYDGNPVEIWKYSHSSCFRIDAADSILRTKSAFVLNPLDKDDLLDISGSFSADTIRLYRDYFGYPCDMEIINSDTTIIHCATFNYTCNNFPSDEIKYIGVKFENSERLGWIKLSLFEGYKILIMESGIQE